MSETTDSREFAVTGPIGVQVRVGGGSLSVLAEQTSTATARVTPYDDSEESMTAAEQTRVEFADGTLRIHAPEASRSFRRGRVAISVRVPLDSSLRADVGSATVLTEGRLGNAEVHSGSGDARIGHTTGDLNVESGSGDVRAGDVGGALRVKTGSGDVAAETVAGPVNVKVASGDVRLSHVSGPVQASSASGDIGIGSARTGEVKISSASGDVSVGVPSGTGVWLDLNTVTGTTSNDLAMTGGAPEGGATLTLRVSTVSGDITVHRVSAAAA